MFLIIHAAVLFSVYDARAALFRRYFDFVYVRNGIGFFSFTRARILHYEN